MVIIQQLLVIQLRKNKKESTDSYNVFRYSGIFAKYKKDGEEITKKTETGSRDIYFSDMLVTKYGYTIVGQHLLKNQVVIIKI